MLRLKRLLLVAEANAQRGPRSVLAIGHGTTHDIFEPLDFFPIPKPKANLKLFYGVSPPNGKQLISRQ